MKLFTGGKVFLGIVFLFIVTVYYGKVFAKEQNIINPEQVYTYEILTNDIKNLAQQYPELIQYKSIGKSEYEREIWAIRLGTGEATVFLNGAHHAREWMTTNVLMNMLEEYAKAYREESNFEGYNVKELLDKVSIWFVPMVNPDGVTLQQKGLSSLPKAIHASLIKMNGGSTNFNRWKANAKGVDLNRQYPADWKNIKYNKIGPSFENHKGSSPLIAKEAKAMVNFTNEINPELTAAYHSSGEIIYWYFNTKKQNMARDRKIADLISGVTGYSLVPAEPKPSGGGYKDWFIQQFDRPGFTVEISPYIGETHVPLSKYPQIWKQNKKVGLLIASEGSTLSQSKINKQVNTPTKNKGENSESKKQKLLLEIQEWEEKLNSSKTNTKTVFAKLEKLYQEAGQNHIKIFANQQKLILKTQPVIYSQVLLIQLKEMVEKLGGEVIWEDEKRTIWIFIDDKVIQMPIDGKQLLINGEPIIIKSSITVIKGQTFISIDFLKEHLNMKVDWRPHGKMVIIE